MGALLAGASLLIGSTWWLLLRQLDEIFERNLEQVALAVADQRGTYGIAGPPSWRGNCPGSTTSTASSSSSRPCGRATARECTVRIPASTCRSGHAAA